MSLPLAPSGRRRLVGVSTKMYFDLPTTLSYADQVAELLGVAQASQRYQTDTFLLPDFITLMAVAERVVPHGIWVGGQDGYSELQGAYTGEVSPLVLSQVQGARLVELGHAERRKFFAETDASVVRKALAALRVGLTPLICVGEMTRYDVSVSSERDKAVQEIWTQVKGVFTSPEVGELEKHNDELEVVLAYEPVWAIGAQEPASAEYVVTITKALRALAEPYLSAGGGAFKSVRILYGGSAGPGTFSRIQEGVDGLFLGRFAHDPKRFVQTVLEVSGAEA